jgi:hypothetical protein
LADFSVTTHTDFDPRLEEIKGDAASAKQWLLADLNVNAGFRATVPVNPTQSRLETYVWS